MANMTREALLQALEDYYKEIGFAKVRMEDLKDRPIEQLQAMYDDAMEDDED